MSWHPPVPPPPGSTRPSRRRPLLLVLGAGCTALAVLLGLVSWFDFTDARGPSATVRSYFNALADGHAATALGLAAQPPTGAAAQFLTAKVLAQQLKIAGISQVHVTATRRQGSRAVVDVRYTLGFADGPQRVDDTVALVQRGSSWRLSAVAAPARLVASGAARVRLTLMGRPWPTNAVALFPGAVPLSSDTPAVVVADDPAVTLAGLARETDVDVEVSTQARTQVLTGLTNALRTCLAATSTDPRCPIVNGGRPVPGSMHGTLLTPLNPSTIKIGLATKGKGLLSITAVAEVAVHWYVWDFNNQAVARQQSTKVTLSALASVDDPGTTVWAAADA
ncbi:MAG: hypothetical protein JWO63_1314 [Frankiales bacterium]|nr:hypothetical protein [Frankiales bacterium]